MLKSFKGGIIFLLFLITLAGVFFLKLITQNGVGLSPDSVSYIYAARSLLSGKGLIEMTGWNEMIPMVRYAPFYPIQLAAVGVLGFDPLEAARGVNLFLFAANIIWIGYMIWFASCSKGAALWGAAFTATSFVMLEIHSMAWSEPGFILLGFLGSFLLARYLSGSAHFWFLAASALLAGLAFLQKYSGASWVAAGILSLLFCSSRKGIRRMNECLFFGFLGCLPMALWIARNKLVADNPTGLSFHFQPYLGVHVREVLAHLSIWLLPQNVPALIRGLVLLAFLVFLGLIIIVSRFTSHPDSFQADPSKKSFAKNFYTLCGILIFSHIGIYFLTSVFLGRQPIDDRALSPVFVAVVILLSALGTRVWNSSSCFAPIFRQTLRLFFFIVAGMHMGRGFYWGGLAEMRGLGYASREWKNSETLQGIKALSTNTPIFSNGYDVIYIQTGRTSLAIPAKEDTLRATIPEPKDRLNQSYSTEMDKMREMLIGHQGVIVYLNRIQRSYYPTEHEIQEKLHLQTVARFSDGAIYRLNE